MNSVVSCGLDRFDQRAWCPVIVAHICLYIVLALSPIAILLPYPLHVDIGCPIHRHVSPHAKNCNRLDNTGYFRYRRGHIREIKHDAICC